MRALNMLRTSIGFSFKEKPPQEISETSTKDFFIKKNQESQVDKAIFPGIGPNLKISKSNHFRGNNNDHDSISCGSHYLKIDIEQINHLMEKFDDMLIINSLPVKPQIFKSCRGEAGIQQKLSEIKERKQIDITTVYNRIHDISHQFPILSAEFGRKSKEELITKLSTELFYLQYFVTRLNDLAVLFNLKYNNENKEFISTFRKNYSQFDTIKFMINKFINLYNEKNKANYKKTLSSQDSMVEIDDTKKIQLCTTLSEFMSFETENSLIQHIRSLILKSTDYSTDILLDLIKSLNVSGNQLKLLKSSKSDIIQSCLNVRKIIEESYAGLQSRNLKTESELAEIKAHTHQDFILFVNQLKLASKDSYIYITSLDHEVQQQIQELQSSERNELLSEIETLHTTIQELHHEKAALENDFLLLNQNINYANGFVTCTDYIHTLISINSNMKKGFLEKMNTLASDAKKKEFEAKKRIAELQEQLKFTQEAKWLFLNRIETMENQFYGYIKV